MTTSRRHYDIRAVHQAAMMQCATNLPLVCAVLFSVSVITVHNSCWVILDRRLSDYNAQQLLSYFGSSFFVLIFTLVFLQLCYATEMVTAVMSMTCLSGEQTANHGSRITPLNMPSGNTLQWASGNHIQHYSVVLVLLVLSISVTEQNVGRLQQCKRNRRWAIMTGTMLTHLCPFVIGAS